MIDRPVGTQLIEILEVYSSLAHGVFEGEEDGRLWGSVYRKQTQKASGVADFISVTTPHGSMESRHFYIGGS